MSKVLVVGATGLLGKAASSALEDRGNEVHRAARRIEPSKRAHRVDLENSGETREVLRRLRPHLVVQLTGGTRDDPRRLVEANLLPTINLLQAAAELEPAPRILIAGSAAEYGAPDEGNVRETQDAAPLSGYGWIKYTETTVAAVLAKRHGLDLTVIRPFNVVSSDLPESTALGNFRMQLLEQTGKIRTVTCGRVDVIRDFVGASFVGQAIALLVECEGAGIVNICSGIGQKLEDLMSAVADLMAVELRLDLDPILVAIPAPDRIVGDPSRLRSLVGLQAESKPHSLARELLGDHLP